MTISFDVPGNIEQILRQEGKEPSLAAKEAALVELYRRGRLNRRDLSDSLGLSRYETDGLLKRHNVTEDLITPEEYDAEREGLRKLLDR